MSKTIILHVPTGRKFESCDRVTKCPFGKKRKMKPTDSIYNDVCDSCQDYWGGWQNSQEKESRCYYEKIKRT